jgi:hypothetical protein
MGWIYALVDPRDSLPHYIGYTVALPGRMAEWKLRITEAVPVGSKPVEQWLADLRSRDGRWPRVRIMQTLSRGPAQFVANDAGVVVDVLDGRRATVERTFGLRVEAAWIAYGIRRGWPLTNVQQR